MNATDFSGFLSLWSQPGLTTIREELFDRHDVQVDLLRLDQLHPQVSGNKWFKLKYNLMDAIRLSAAGIVSFGGAYSNHLHALAYAGHRIGMPTTGIVRGEAVSNPTMDDCRRWGMHVHFVSRTAYRVRHTEMFLEQVQQQFPAYAVVPEGGNNAAGRRGSAEILDGIELSPYTHIGLSVGSGATLCGVLEAGLTHQHVLGFAALKQAAYLKDEIAAHSDKTNWSLIEDAHEGGFGKFTPALLQFMHEFETKHGIELDVVYTAKMMKAVYGMIAGGQMPAGSRMLLIHTGGLQGNRSIR